MKQASDGRGRLARVVEHVYAGTTPRHRLDRLDFRNRFRNWD
jgi:hypothetical protein